jgi:hypothetical protein
MSPRFDQSYREFFSSLGIVLNSKDGCVASGLVAAEKRLALSTPLALRDFFLVAGREAKLTRAHNRLLPPGEWFVDAGRLVFLEENQTAVFWGVPVTADGDPSVDQGVNGSAIEWHAEHERCSVFLKVMFSWQAVMGGLGRTWSARVDDDFAQRLHSWTALGSIHELQAYSANSTALCYVPWNDGPRIFVSGVDESGANALAHQFGILWDPDYG